MATPRKIAWLGLAISAALFILLASFSGTKGLVQTWQGPSVMGQIRFELAQGNNGKEATVVVGTASGTHTLECIALLLPLEFKRKSGYVHLLVESPGWAKGLTRDPKVVAAIDGDGDLDLYALGPVTWETPVHLSLIGK